MQRVPRHGRALGLGLILAAVVGTPALWAYWLSETLLVGGGTRVEGTIDGTFSERDPNDYVFFHPIVRYVDPSGATHQLRDASLEAASESMAKRWEGKKRTVVIDPDDPDHAVAVATVSPMDPENMMTMLGATGAGVLALLFGIGILASTFRAPRKISTAPSALAGVVVGLGVCVVGAAVAWFSLQHAAKHRALQQDGAEVEGTIVSYSPAQHPRPGFYPIVEYVDHRGEIFQASVGVPHASELSEAQHWLGKPHPVRYHRDDPTSVLEDPDNFTLSEIVIPFVVGLLGVIALPVGLGIVGVSLWRRNRALKRNAAQGHSP